MAREPRRAAARGTEAGAAARARNPGAPFDAAWVRGARATTPNRSEREATARAHEPHRATSGGPDTTGPRSEDRDDARSPGSDAIGLLEVLDLTLLGGDDTPARVRELCRRARAPLPSALLRRCRLDLVPRVAAICIHPVFLETATDALAGTGVRIAAVAGGFPDGLSRLETRLGEIRACVAAGADEVDVVIARYHALNGDWRRLHDEVRAFRDAAGDATLKVILAVTELDDPGVVARASATCLLAGADFLKTSTGREARPARLVDGTAMLREIRRFERAFGIAAGFKAAGGVGTVAAALAWRRLADTMIGPPPLDAERFRIGASRLLDAIRASLHDGARAPGPRTEGP